MAGVLYCQVDYALSHNYPNPFNPTTTIRYQVPEDARVVITVYNMLGHEMTTLVDQHLPDGYYRAVWDGRNQAGLQVVGGVYIFRMEANQFNRTRKVLL